MRKLLSPGEVQMILDKRAILDDWGEPRFSGATIAADLGVSESTVWRVIRQQAAYAKRAPLSRAQQQQSAARAAQEIASASTEGMEAAAAESLRKLEALLKGEAPAAKEAVPPPRAELPTETPPAAESLTEMADRLLKEHTDGNE